MRTNDKYDSEKIGEFELESVLATEKDFELDLIRKNISDRTEEGWLIGALTPPVPILS